MIWKENKKFRKMFIVADLVSLNAHVLKLYMFIYKLANKLITDCHGLRIWDWNGMPCLLCLVWCLTVEACSLLEHHLMAGTWVLR